MNLVYPFFQSKALLMTALCAALCGGTANSQTCGQVAENFNTPSRGMAGFTSSTAFSTAPGFRYGTGSGTGALEVASVPSGGTVYQIATPTYQTLLSQNSVGYGFDLSGEVGVQRISVLLQYIDNSGNVNTVEVENFAPSYNGAPPAGTANVCKSVAMNSYSGFTPGDTYRFVFSITAQYSSSAAQHIYFDNFKTTGAGAQATLPVTFTAITARRASSGNEVIWNVAGEKDVVRYEVEKSANGRDFTTIGQVSAMGAAAYSFTDNNAGGITYYRVRNVDIDGKFKYTKIIRASGSKAAGIKAYPQPAGAEVTIEHAEVEGKGSITVLNSGGQVVKTIGLKPGMNQTLLSLEGLRSGLYLVRFDNGSGIVETVSVIRQ